VIFCSLAEVLLRCEGQIAHINGSMAVALSESEAAVNSPKLARPNRCKKVCVVRSADGRLSLQIPPIKSSLGEV
jgi:hypothetical protein